MNSICGIDMVLFDFKNKFFCPSCTGLWRSTSHPVASQRKNRPGNIAKIFILNPSPCCGYPDPWNSTSGSGSWNSTSGSGSLEFYFRIRIPGILLPDTDLDFLHQNVESKKTLNVNVKNSLFSPLASRLESRFQWSASQGASPHTNDSMLIRVLLIEII